MLLKKLLLIGVLAVSLATAAQIADCYDTLMTRNGKQMLIPKYDTIKQLDRASQTADSILNDLSIIMKQLNITDTTNETGINYIN